MRPCCPSYTVTKEDPSLDILIYTVVTRPQPHRQKGSRVNFIEIPEVIGFDKTEAATAVAEEVRRKIKERRTTPRSHKKASDPD